VNLAAHGIAAQLPTGWEGSIASEQQELVEAQTHAFSTGDRSAQILPVAHFATVGLPAGRDDFGSTVVGDLGPDDVFVSLLEYAPEEANSALFSQEGLPRRLDPREFSPRMLQRMMRGQSGLQLFFNDGGRAFCLYIVLGSADDAHRLVRRVEQVLATVQIEEQT